MSTVRIIAAHQNLISTVTSYLPSGQRDYSSTLVVFPGKRPAYFLRKELARREGRVLVPPHIVSFDLFVEELFRNALGMRQRRLDPLDAVAILYEVHRRLARPLGGESYSSLDHFIPLALRLIPELEEVSLADATGRRIRELLRLVLVPKFHSLPDYYEAFYREIEVRGFVTRSTMTKQVADRLSEVDLNQYSSILLAGFYAFTAAEGRIIRRLLEREQVTMIFQSGPGLKHQLSQLGIDSWESDDEQVGAPLSVEFHKAPDVHGQVAVLARLLQEKRQSHVPADERTAIILPDAGALFPTYHGALSLLEDDEFNIALGYPLERTPICGLFRTLLELAAGTRDGLFTPASYLRFVLHPYMKSIRLKNRADLTRIMMHVIESHLSEYSLGLLFRLEDLENHEEMLKSATRALQSIHPEIVEEDVRSHLRDIHDRTIRPFLSCTSIGVFSSNAIEVLNYIFTESTARYHPLFQPYADGMIDLFQRMGTSLLKDHCFPDLQQYLAFFRHVVKGETVPFSGTPIKGVQVLGLLETRNLQFDVLYVLDANDDVLPGKPDQDLLLPQNIRRMLGLETHTERETLKEYYFTLALSGSREVHLFYSEEGRGKEEKSRFVEKLLWREQQRRKSTVPSEREHSVRYRVNLVNPIPSPIRKTDALVAALRNGHEFSASQLDDYLHCPLRFYYKHVLRVRGKDDVSDEIDQGIIGNLVHEVLKRFFHPTCNGVLRKEQLESERLKRIIGEVSREFFGATIPVPIQLSLGQVTRQLQSFLDRYQIPLITSENVVIRSLEEELKVEKNGYRFSGRIDRIESRGERQFILDYKTGKVEPKGSIKPEKIDPDDTRTWSKGIKSFQLPLYLLLYVEKHSVSPEQVAPRYLHLGRNKIDETIEFGMSTEANSELETYRFVEPLIFKMIDEIVNIEKDFSPTLEITKNCPFCPYKAICGTQWVGRSGR